jgi:hypothetical protein
MGRTKSSLFVPNTYRFFASSMAFLLPCPKTILLVRLLSFSTNRSARASRSSMSRARAASLKSYGQINKTLQTTFIVIDVVLRLLGGLRWSSINIIRAKIIL